MLARARQLLGWPGIAVACDVPRVSFFHLMFDGHEIVRANGVPSESHFLGDRMRVGLPKAQIAEILAPFPELASRPPRPARPFARAYEVTALTDQRSTVRRPRVP